MATLRIIKAAQRLGFTLDEVADLLHVTQKHARPDSGLHARGRQTRRGRRETPRADRRARHPACGAGRRMR
ncbi:MerR family DNA-binding protein [Nocardia vaccinii]|uniref:MerR family DNA-binding protein n=1 Tax=Nocardia vaccinii TaxID=1822 RepID=UPI0024800AD5|nr:MerR family DNA-binding protein [Nocardia vaccinii]